MINNKAITFWKQNITPQKQHVPSTFSRKRSHPTTKKAHISTLDSWINTKNATSPTSESSSHTIHKTNIQKVTFQSDTDTNSTISLIVSRTLTTSVNNTSQSNQQHDTRHPKKYNIQSFFSPSRNVINTSNPISYAQNNNNPSRDNLLLIGKYSFKIFC